MFRDSFVLLEILYGRKHYFGVKTINSVKDTKTDRDIDRRQRGKEERMKRDEEETVSNTGFG